MHTVKVLHVHTLPVISGSGINTLLSMAGLKGKGYKVDFACAPGGPLIDEAAKYGIGIRPIAHFVQPLHLYSDFMALVELCRVIRKGCYDIVHTHNSKAGFIGRLAARLCRVPVIIHTVHGFAFHDFEKPVRRQLFIFLERWASRWADKLIVISNPLRKWGLRVGVGKPEQYITIYSGIELRRFLVQSSGVSKRKELGIPPGHKAVGVVAKLWEGKGHECVLGAAARIVKEIPEVSFVFVGEGYLRKNLEARAKSLALEKNVIFTGFRTDIPEVTAAFDIAVLASYFEGLGRVLLEAMASGKAVVATRVGGIVDVVDDGVTGLLVEVGNAEALAQAIKRLLIDDNLRRRMGEAGRMKISEKFSAETMVGRIETVYEELLVQKGIRRDNTKKI